MPADEPESELRRADLSPDPLEQFRQWFAEAADVVDVPEAMALATAAPGGAPSVRMVLLKGFDASGLVFYSHYTSRKGRELEANPQAALLFHWRPSGRQVRVEGRVERVSAENSVASRAELYERLAELEEDLSGGPVPRPPTWGGYLLVPAAWEFWQHRASRLHDRFRYERESPGGWRIERLFP
jgi:pyridoxamine 5'-phosphate oxidase